MKGIGDDESLASNWYSAPISWAVVVLSIQFLSLIHFPTKSPGCGFTSAQLVK
ncbi:MAG: hypothetical protein LBD63_01540 [Mycoplasmataceae bacterium]|nr:hypothetical protein [Mycoplasmataceae bacterium]